LPGPGRLVLSSEAKDSLIREGERLLMLCNACRYCEGYCAVFPAMERRTAFSAADVNYLANLCHNCGECYYACPYTPPHEYALNLPKTLVEIRVQSYEQYAWPGVLASAFRHSGLALTLVFALALAAMAVVADRSGGAGGNFYGVIPHRTMALAMGAVFGLAAITLLAGFVRFWRETGEGFAGLFQARPFLQASKEALRLEYLRGHGAGCRYPQERLSQSRRWFHHAAFYGFLLCFASTSVAAFYHFILHWSAPYPYFSLPVVLGTLGGIGLVIGPAGLYWLKRQRDPAVDDLAPRALGDGFIALLLLTSLTGLLLLVLRNTAALSSLLVIHLGVVLAFFATLPYQKFVHGIYRFGALLRNAVESSTVNRATLARHNPTQ
jgi:citrate/tricarballylate utilization protein